MKLRILGTRGIPARHGGFETFAESLSLYMTAQGHEVTVYCQTGEKRNVFEDRWRNVDRVFLYGPEGPVGTMLFDLKAVLHAVRRDGLVLTLGYNTAVFSLIYVLWRRVSLMNMDGLEWMREKWTAPQRLWLRLNEFAGAHLSTHLIADHPEIGKHLQHLVRADKITVIPYGSEVMPLADPQLLRQFGCEPHHYALCIARPEPENSVLEIVQAFSRRHHGYPMILLGRLDPEHNAYHRQVVAAASDEVILPGAIYATDVVQALRQYACFHLHGHRVGGTNPSLVEAMAAGSAIIAHRNRFNEWVAKDGARYFSTEDELDAILLELEQHPEQASQLRKAARAIHKEGFETASINRAYEVLLERYA